jgi:hypothetical protein
VITEEAVARDAVPTTLEADLNRAIEASIASGPLTTSPPIGAKPTNGSRRAVDQLAQARDGLLKVEQELNALCDAIAGSVDAVNPSKPSNPDRPEGLPMFDRVRSDATTLAELAIRMHTRIAHAMERL